jgi:SPP1 gp7 family putative phage head morphogenesis protein
MENKDLPADPKSSASDNLVSRLYFGTAEQTVQESAYHPDSYNKPDNPDELVQKDTSYKIYEEMLVDDQVSVTLQLKKDLVLNSGWNIHGDDGQEEIVDDLKTALCVDTPIPFEEQLEEILTAYEFGFSISEKIFQLRDDGSLTLNVLKTRHPASWRIHTDEKGNVTKYEQVGTKGNSLDIKANTIIHYVNNRRFQNPYGVSDLRAAFSAWFVKREITKYYAIFLEKAASPIPVARYDKAAPESAVTKIFNVIKRFQQKTAIAIPKDIELEFLDSGNHGDAYIKGINMFNMFIGRALFVPDLMGLHGSQTAGGSFALGAEHFKLYAKHIAKRRSILERVINDHIIKPLVVYNFGFQENYPTFKLKEIDDSTAIEAAKLWLEAVKGGAYKPNDNEINYFRSIVKFPEGEVQHKDAMPSYDPRQTPAKDEPVEEPEEPEEVEGKEEVEQIEPYFGPMQDKDMENMKGFKGKMSLPTGNYYKKVDFKKIGRQLDARVDAINTEAEPIIDMVFEDLYDQMAKKKIIESGDIERLDSIKLKKLKDLKQILKKNLRQQYDSSLAMAQSEIMKGKFAKPILAQEFLDILEQENFSFIGDWEYKVRQKAKLELIAAIKDGRPLSTVIGILDDEGKKLSQDSINRYARTKTTEVMNKGRKEFFDKNETVKAYQYSALMDDRTTEICSAIDGKIFDKDEAPIPPLHFNCRSLLIPITEFEEYQIDETVETVDDEGNVVEENINDFIEENKGAGFATK